MVEQVEHADSIASERQSRRAFLKESASNAVAAGVLTSALARSQPVHAAGSDEIRIGLIGCGGRGTGAASQALAAGEDIRLVAMADAFDDRLELSLANLEKIENVAGRVDVPPERRFVGFDAYRQLLASGVDVVLLTTPPHFRPLHLKAAIDAGVHVFAEKPVAVDAPGVRSVLATCELARQRGLSVVSGLCLRYDAGFRETVARLHDGAIGDVHTLVANDYRGPIWVKPRQPGWTDMHWQMRNWYYFTWLSGDFNVEQHVHYLDVCSWIFGGYPERAVGMGGRQVRTGEEYGNIYDHHGVTYTYANGARLFSNTRQQAGCFNNMSAHAVGSRGHAEVSERRLEITGDAPSKFEGKPKNMYQVEHDELFAGIRAGQPINNGQYMAQSTLLAIMGRMATYTGKEVTWQQALESKEDLSPESYAWGPAPEVKIAIPGVTQLV